MDGINYWILLGFPLTVAGLCLVGFAVWGYVRHRRKPYWAVVDAAERMLKDDAIARGHAQDSWPFS